MDEEPEYLCLDDAAEFIGMKRPAIYGWIKDFEITTHRFTRNRKRYIALEDAKRLKEIKEKPWLAGRRDRQS